MGPKLLYLPGSQSYYDDQRGAGTWEGVINRRALCLGEGLSQSHCYRSSQQCVDHAGSYNPSGPREDEPLFLGHTAGQTDLGREGKNLGSVSKCPEDFGQVPSLSEPVSSFVQSVCQEEGVGKGVHRRALWVLTCRAPGPGQPPRPAAPSTSHLVAVLRGSWEEGGSSWGPGPCSLALPPPWASPGLSGCLVLGQSGLVYGAVYSQLASVCAMP